MKTEDVFPSRKRGRKPKTEESETLLESNSKKIPFYLPDPLVSPSFRKLVFDTYNSLDDEFNGEAAVRMMAYILFGKFFDRYDGKSEEKRIVIPQELVAKIEKKTLKNYAAIEFLKWFDERVLQLNLSDYSSLQGQARSIQPEIDFAIIEALQREPSEAKGKVLFSTGTVATAMVLGQKLKEINNFQEARSIAVPNTHHGKKLIEYLTNDVNQSALQRLLKRNKQHLFEFVEKLPPKKYVSPKRKGKADYEQRLSSAKRILSNIYDFGELPKLYYGISENTPRILPIGDHIFGLPREARKIALKGAVELDLEACQLAVIGKIWSIPLLQDFLAKSLTSNPRHTFWDEMLNYLSLESDAKPVLKEAIYSTVFGASKRNVGETIETLEWFDEGYRKKFEEHYLVKSIYEARQNKLALLRKNRSFTDAFGKEHRIIYKTAGMNPQQKREEIHQELRRAMAYEAQSYEAKVMLSILDVVREEKQMYLLLWLHDGITILHSKPENIKQRVYKKLKKAVEETSRQEGIITTLVWEEL